MMPAIGASRTRVDAGITVMRWLESTHQIVVCAAPRRRSADPVSGENRASRSVRFAATSPCERTPWAARERSTSASRARCVVPRGKVASFRRAISGAVYIRLAERGRLVPRPKGNQANGGCKGHFRAEEESGVMKKWVTQSEMDAVLVHAHDAIRRDGDFAAVAPERLTSVSSRADNARTIGTKRRVARSARAGGARTSAAPPHDCLHSRPTLSSGPRNAARPNPSPWGTPVLQRVHQWWVNSPLKNGDSPFRRREFAGNFIGGRGTVPVFQRAVKGRSTKLDAGVPRRDRAPAAHPTTSSTACARSARRWAGALGEVDRIGSRRAGSRLTWGRR
jgi:hypothetical protein